MRALKHCFDANRAWAAGELERDPEFFERLRHQQHPELLWIGCSDSRLPPDRIIGVLPGEIFVHRNGRCWSFRPLLDRLRVGLMIVSGLAPESAAAGSIGAEIPAR